MSTSEIPPTQLSRFQSRETGAEAPLSCLSPAEAEARLRTLTDGVDPVLDIVIPEKHLPDYLGGLGWTAEAIAAYLSSRQPMPPTEAVIDIADY